MADPDLPGPQPDLNLPGPQPDTDRIAQVLTDAAEEMRKFPNLPALAEGNTIRDLAIEF